MSFMQPEIRFGRWFRVETDYGTEIVPVDLIIGPGTPDQPMEEALAPFCGGRVESWEAVTGVGWRLSAPGYMDHTEWDVIPVDEDTTKEQALQQAYASLVEQYPECFPLVLQDGTIHRYCSCDEEAIAIVSALQTTNGTAWERDGDFIYCKITLDVDDEDMRPDGVTEEDVIAHNEQQEQEAVAELEAAGFDVREA